MSLLVYDDSASVGRLVVRIAGLLGMTATAVTDAETFAERLIADQPPIVVLDLELGNTNGAEQLHVAAGQRCSSSIVLMSGHDAGALTAAGALGRSLGLNIDGMVQKPLRVAELERILELAHSNQQSRSALRDAAAERTLHS